MRFDVHTLYCLIVCTTLVAACLTFWERRFNPAHRSALGLWALGYLLISTGCALRIAEPLVPPFAALGLSNVAVCWGYAAVAFGVVRFTGRRIAPAVPSLLALLSFAWLVSGYGAPMAVRIVLTSLVSGCLCLWTTGALLRNRPAASSLPSRPLAALLFGVHGAFFLTRAAMTGLDLGADVVLSGTNVTLTMFEGVLWSASAPMALLVLAREATQDRLVAASNTDYLTALDNRRAFFEKGERLLERAASTGLPTTLLAFDLDHFKTINDRYGHGTGDDVLRLFAGIARRLAGPGALLARLGGEEFVALLPGCDADASHALAEDIAAAFSADAARSDGLAIPVTVSIGLAEAAHEGSELANLLREADRALYLAKANGRNRIEGSSLQRRAA